MQAVSFPGGFVVSNRISSCKSSVTVSLTPLAAFRSRPAESGSAKG